MREEYPGFHFLQMEECIAAIDESIQQLLDLMVQKDTTSGNLAVKLNFDLTNMLATDGESGEVVTLYSPEISFEIKKRIKLEVAGIKGREPRKGQIQNKDGHWVCSDLRQMTIFE